TRSKRDWSSDVCSSDLYGFSQILESDNIQQAFASQVPYFDYHQMTEKWWTQLHKGIPDISWPGLPSFLARSSGTTGKKSKKLPEIGRASCREREKIAGV